MSKRLLIIIDEMEVGGSQRNIVDMARSMDSSTFSLSLVYFRTSSPYVEELRALGVEVTHIAKRRRVDPFFFLRLCKYIRRNDFDIIHAFSFSGEWWGWLANLLAGNARFVSTVHSVYEWYSPLQWMIKRWVALGSDAIVANSQAGADYAALRAGIRRSRIDVVRNGIVLPEANPPSSKEKTGDELRLLFVGRLVDHKNVDCLLRAFTMLAGQAPGVHLDIVGDGPLRLALEEQARNAGIDSRVHFHGERNDVNAFLVAADIFVMTSFREGLSNALMEAMGAGLPAVVSNVGGNPELVLHERTGMLFPTDDHETLAAMLLELVNDPEKRRRFSEEARNTALRFNDPRRMAAEMQRIYERCLFAADADAVGRNTTS